MNLPSFTWREMLSNLRMSSGLCCSKECWSFRVLFLKRHYRPCWKTHKLCFDREKQTFGPNSCQMGWEWTLLSKGPGLPPFILPFHPLRSGSYQTQVFAHHLVLGLWAFKSLQHWALHWFLAATLTRRGRRSPIWMLYFLLIAAYSTCRNFLSY